MPISAKLPPKTMKVQYYDEWSDMLFAEYEITQEEYDGLLAITDEVVYKPSSRVSAKLPPLRAVLMGIYHPL